MYAEAQVEFSLGTYHLDRFHQNHKSDFGQQHRLLDRYDRFCFRSGDHNGLGFVLKEATLAFRVLYRLGRLGSEGTHKFHTARVLRTNFATKLFLYLLLKLTVHVEEPYRTRARAQLRSIFDFRQLLFPPTLKPIRCLQLCHGFVQQAAD